MEQSVLIEHDSAAGVLSLTLDRPQKRNALNLSLLHALRDALLAAPQHPGARALVLRGAGPAFCSGLDLVDTANVPHEAADAVQDALLALANCPLPTIAVVHGHAVAGGAGLVAACDFALMAEEAKIGYPEVKRGLVAALVSVFLRRQLRERDLRELLLAGELISATRAAAIGLVTRVAPLASLDSEVHELVGVLAGGGPEALGATKHLLLTLAPSSLEDDCARALDAHRAARDSAEAREGAAAFLEKRAPRWAAGQQAR